MGDLPPPVVTIFVILMDGPIGDAPQNTVNALTRGYSSEAVKQTSGPHRQAGQGKS